MKDLLLIKPISDYKLQYTPPLGLGFISNYLKKCGFSVNILDCNTRNITPETLADYVDLDTYRFIGLQAYDMDLFWVDKYIKAIKDRRPNVWVIVGGPAPSSNPELVFNFLKSADFLCVGEGEITLERFLRIDRDKGTNKEFLQNIPNLSWRNDDNGIYLTPHEYVLDLNIIGPPDWDELNPHLYGNAVHGFFYRRLPVLPIMTSRGCPFRCSFCGSRNVTGYKVRRRNADQVLDELEYLKNKYGLQEFQVVDDNFTASPSAALEFADKLIKRNLNLLWTCPNGLRLDTLNKNLLKTMKESGCYEVAVGIESGDEGILKDMGKYLTTQQIKEKIGLISEQKINVVGFVMVGYPLETGETLRRTMKFVLSLPLKRISLTKFIPMPGTPIAERLISKGEITCEQMDPANLHYGEFSYIPPAFSEKELNHWYRLFFLKFLLRWQIIIHNIRNIRSLSHAKIVLQKLFWFLR